ncbi:hypothetical protein MYX07_04110 [Patescibacteria group bacterium AH-259-L07]|nr:hypothetical protein [Patescibacteria group bacterium AH-259-L07]
MIIDVIQQFFPRLPEPYSTINFIAEIPLFGQPLNFYIYLIIAGTLIILGLRVIQKRIQWHIVQKLVLYIMTAAWIAAFLFMAGTQISWLVNDGKDLHGRSLAGKQARMTERLIDTYYTSSYRDFYQFLEFAKTHTKTNKTVYLVSPHATFQVWAQYWLYPHLALRNSMPVHYILIFGIDEEQLPIPDSYQLIKEYAPHKRIYGLKQ